MIITIKDEKAKVWLEKTIKAIEEYGFETVIEEFEKRDSCQVIHYEDFSNHFSNANPYELAQMILDSELKSSDFNSCEYYIIDELGFISTIDDIQELLLMVEPYIDAIVDDMEWLEEGEY